MSVGLMLELRPIRVLFSRTEREVTENFTCSYHSSDPLRMTITRQPSWVEDGAPAALMDSQAPHLIEQYAHGAKYYSLLRLLRGHRAVVCRVYDASIKEVAQMSSQILYTYGDWTDWGECKLQVSSIVYGVWMYAIGCVCELRREYSKELSGNVSVCI